LRFLKSFAPILLLALLHVPPTAAQFPPAPGTGPGLPETIEAIDSARVTTRILYITAHPDDESAAVLTYLARGLHADVALLSITRGEGGQNALGPEQAPQLGLIRTQELLAATRGYGVKLYFTRAHDFGYSKTPEETEKIWGDQVLEDMVLVIREFRPNIVINHWGGVHSGHGHHQVSGLWTPKAVALAADPSFKMTEPSVLQPNRAVGRILSKPVLVLNLERDEKPKGYVLPLDEVSPLWGKTWREIGLDAFVNHRTQGIAGFLNSPFLRRPIALVREDGTAPDPALFVTPLSEIADQHHLDEAFRKRLETIDRDLISARQAALRLDWPTAEKAMDLALQEPDMLLGVHLYPNLETMELENDLANVWLRINEAWLLVAGYQVIATADRSEIVAGESFTIKVIARRRDMHTGQYEGRNLMPPVGWEVSKEEKEPDGSSRFVVSVPAQAKLGRDPNSWILPEPKPIVEALGGANLKPGTKSIASDRTPVIALSSTSTTVSRVPIRLVPAYTLAVEPNQAVEVLPAEHKPFDIFLRVHSYSTKSAKVSVGLNVPDGLQSTAPVELSFDGIGDQYAKFTVTPPASLAPGNFTITAYAKRGDETFSTSLEPLPSMPSILWSEPAQCIVHAFDINVPPNLRVGYISAEGEPIPEALKRLGINVEMLDATALNFGDLSNYDAIVVGVRAYELRPELPGANKRLLDYVSNGGTLVVQYNRDSVWDKLQPAPYPAKIGSPTPRTTDETAEVKFLQPNDPLLNSPNKITAADFNNWVQERGLYYWSNFDSHYTPLLTMHDPGESDLNGSLVYTHYGQGTYIYTGLSFFRQLPEGNSGAYRLFVNLISASRTSKPGAAH
jgi:LmbE family N-acetylglucosaminyl deacetylase